MSYLSPFNSCPIDSDIQLPIMISFYFAVCVRTDLAHVFLELSYHAQGPRNMCLVLQTVLVIHYGITPHLCVLSSS